MNDISRFNYKDYPIYLIVIYDLEENQIQFFQKIPLANFGWMKPQIHAHIRHLLYLKQKQGKTLYSDLTDYNFTGEIKVTSTILNKNALVVFYNSSIDFYQIGPIVYNLRDCIQIVSETKQIEPVKLRKKYVDINTILNDCMIGLNCSNRLITQDLQSFSGKNAIYNEKCFMHLINKSDLLSLFRNHSGEKNYFKHLNQKKNKSNLIERREANINDLKFKVNEDILKHHQAINIDRYQNFNKKIEVPQYKLIKEYKTSPVSNREELFKNAPSRVRSTVIQNEEEKKNNSTNFSSPSNGTNKNEINIASSTLASVDLDFDRLKQKGMMSDHSITTPYQSEILHSNENITSHSIDSYNYKSEHKHGKKSGFSKQYLDNRSISNNDLVNNKRLEIEEKKGIIDSIESLDFQTIAKINQSVIQMSNKQNNDSEEILKAKSNLIPNENSKFGINQVFQSTPMPIVNLIPLSSSNPSIQSSNSTILFDKKNNQPQILHTHTSKTSVVNSQFNIYNTTINSNIKSSNVFSNSNGNDLNVEKFNTQKPTITISNSNSNIHSSFDENNYIFHTMGNSNSNSNIIQNKLGIFNSVGGSYHISPYIPPVNRLNQKMQQQEISLSNHRYASSSLPPDNNRNITTNTTTNFSEDDMSFLSFNNHQKKEYDDNIVLSKTNPNLLGDLREKYFYYFQKGTLIKSDGKGYIGLNFRNSFRINKKIFSLMILQAKWKDQQYFSNKEFDNSILAKLTEVDYRLECKNVSQDLKIITYYPNPLKIENLVAIKVKNDYNQTSNQVQFEINFSFNKHYISNVYRMLFTMLLRNSPQQKNGFKIINQSHHPVQISESEYRITLNKVVNSISFTIESLIPNPINKIQFCFEMKDCIPSQNDIRINYNNSKLNQFSLNISKLAMINYDYSL